MASLVEKIPGVNDIFTDEDLRVSLCPGEFLFAAKQPPFNFRVVVEPAGKDFFDKPVPAPEGPATQEYRVEWQQQPLNYHEPRVFFLETDDPEKVRPLARAYIERKFGIVRVSINFEPYVRLTGGKIIDS